MAAKTAGTWGVTHPVGIEPLTTFGTTKLHTLGDRCKAVDTGATAYGPGEFIYLEGCASTVRGSVVTFNDNYLTALVVANAIGSVAVALSINVASNYGWYQVLGTGVAACDTVADGTSCYIDGTAGRVDDAVVTGDLIQGMVMSSADDTSTCLVTMTNYPSVTDNLG
jgi:hypothetical protein